MRACLRACVCVCVSILWTYLASLTYLASSLYIDIFTFQQLSCDVERDALSHDIRKTNQSA